MGRTRFNFMVFLLILCISMAQISFGKYIEENEGVMERSRRVTRQTRRYPDPYFLIAPNWSCARVWIPGVEDQGYCGGISSTTGGNCRDRCVFHGFSYHQCRPSYCLCHQATGAWGIDCIRMRFPM